MQSKLLFLLRKMVPPHSTMLSRKVYIKQSHSPVKFEFVARSHLILWHKHPSQFRWTSLVSCRLLMNCLTLKN